MDRGVWGEGGEGPPASYVRACTRVALPARATYPPHTPARHLRAPRLSATRRAGGGLGEEGCREVAELTSVNSWGCRGVWSCAKVDP
nr:MAG TPA: hypothetical protein [Caudoviricetes sp.]